MPDKKRRAKRYFAPIIWAIILIVISTTPGSDMPQMNVSDKLGHLLFYFVQTILFARALVKNHTIDWITRGYIIAALSTMLLGVLLEVIQETWITGRTGDWWDLAANAVGIALAYPFHRFTCRKID